MLPLYAVTLGLVLGFSLVIPPGPMNALIAAKAARSFRSGFATGLGAMSADLVLAAAVGVFHLEVDLRPVLPELDLLGAAVLLVLAVRLLAPSSGSLPEDRTTARTFLLALTVGLANPFQVLWWLTAGLAFAFLGGVPLFVGLFGAVALWIVLFPWAVEAGTRRRPALRRPVLWVSVAAMVLLAGYLALLGLTATLL